MKYQVNTKDLIDAVTKYELSQNCTELLSKADDCENLYIFRTSRGRKKLVFISQHSFLFNQLENCLSLLVGIVDGDNYISDRIDVFTTTIVSPSTQRQIDDLLISADLNAKIFDVDFLKQNDIEFTKLRAMEDGEFNWKIRMTIEGTPLKINVVNQPIYMWREGSEHSITRIGRDPKDNIPQYNYDLCPIGSTIAAINASKFVKKRNPFNGGVNRFIAELMVGQYFTYIECLEKKKIFAKQNFFNAKRFYNEAYKEIENTISEDILKQIYTSQLAAKAKDLIGIIVSVFKEALAKYNVTVPVKYN